MTLKLYLAAFFFLLTHSVSYSQRFYAVVFNQLPKDFQLYARNDSNEAVVPISGVIEVTGYSHMSVVVSRNGKRVAYVRSSLQYKSGESSATFAMSPKIKAEMADYSFEVFAVQNATDSVSMVTRKDVVAGDFYLISGQSNAAAIKATTFASKYCRTIGREPNDNGSFSAADTLWRQSAWSHPVVGYWGLELQRLALETYQIPTCLINGAVPGSQIIYHVPDGSTDVRTLYNHLLYRTRKSGATRIRAFFWLQGEEEALMGKDYYPDKFNSLHKRWEQDYPMVDQFVTLQINVLPAPYYVAGAIRDFQRRTKYLYPKTTTFATVSLPDYDGVHYETKGYGELARRLFRFIAPTVYGSTDTDNISSPDIQQAFYTSAQKNAITLVFDAGQQMRWNADTTITGVDGKVFTRSLKNYFFLDGDEKKVAPVVSAELNGNRVTLRLRESSQAVKLNYLPAYANTSEQYAFVGPYLTNKRGLGAFSFHEFPIAEALEVQNFTATVTAPDKVQVRWQPISGAIRYVLERRVGETGDYVLLKELNAQIQSYDDAQVTYNTAYSYRLRAFSTLSESTYAQASVRTPPLLAVQPVQPAAEYRIYPVPASQVVQVDFGRNLSATVRLSNLQGVNLQETPVVQSSGTSLRIGDLPTGAYLITIETSAGAKVTKTILKQ